MPPMVRFLLVRLLLIPATLLAVTFGLYAMVAFTPPEVRATLYLPKKVASSVADMPRDELRNRTILIIKRYHMEDPLPVQYAYWLVSLVDNRGGYSPTLKMTVMDALLVRTPVTAELTFYSLLLFIPLGLISGLRAGWMQNSRGDRIFRLAAFVATSLPPFIMALVLLSIFYAGLHWFPPSRLSVQLSMEAYRPSFHNYTGLLTIDGLLNRRPEISVDAARHLVLPVITLSLIHWATLGRITRSTVIQEVKKEYMLAGKARGIPNRRLMWSYALRNAISPALSSTALSAASLFTGIFVVEIIFDFRGVSDLIAKGMKTAPDAPAAMGFVIYSVMVVLLIMLVLDILQAVLDPRVREKV